MTRTEVKKEVRKYLETKLHHERIVDWDIDFNDTLFGCFYVSVLTVSEQHLVWKHSMWCDMNDAHVHEWTLTLMVNQ